MEKFIETVRLHPCLWNPDHPDYPELHARGQAWQNVVKVINDDSIPNIKAARTEWRKLRDNHREALKRAKLGQNKLLPAQVTTWKYAKIMQFLEPHMKYRITENIDMEPPVCSRPINSDHDVSTTNPLDQTKTEIPNKRRCTEDSGNILEDNSNKLINIKEPDALESFFNCILKSTRDMPNWMQTQVKKKIFAVIIDAEERLSSQGRNTSMEHYAHPTFIIESKIKAEVPEDS
ncbi:unnamed protein product [Arctia plantaginis]|uniref:MADF domain-containing protein n=1 Tax=Arctia plantaginis TaxID=874455 RepID=A0A8S0ZDZ8_ARCPL|nr:unnamed protein product [Arctia plantaginis]CAB3237414.1 unnamed protein product [Arctia plantaginis]